MSDREAIEAIIATARTTGLVAYSGEVWLSNWKKSTSTKTPQVTFTVSDDEELAPFEGATIAKGKRAGQRYVILAFELDDDEQPIVQDHQAYLTGNPSEGTVVDLLRQGIVLAPNSSREPGAVTEVAYGTLYPAENYTGMAAPGWEAQKAPGGPFSRYASALHKNGWFYARRVLEAIGTDEEFREWIRSQPCVVCGDGDLVEQTGELKCEAAHVNRPSGDSGLGLKADYSCVSLCHKCHVLQHTLGVPGLYLVFRDRKGFNVDLDADSVRSTAFEWFDKQRDEKLKQWASITLKQNLGYSSMTMVPPDELLAWCEKHGIGDTLPACYKQ